DRDQLRLFPGPRPGEFNNKPRFYQHIQDGRDGDHWTDAYPGLCDVHPSGRPIPPSCAFADPNQDRAPLDALQATCGMIGHIDHQVGRLLHLLEERGDSGNTIVVFASDHGEYHGHHGLHGKGLPAYEDCQRVPCLVWAPGLVPARGSVDALLNTAGLPLSLLRMAGIEPAAGMQGHDHSAYWRGLSDAEQEATLIENRATAHSIYQTTLVTGRHKLVSYRDDDDWELYDLQEDPDQYQNLWRQNGHHKLKQQLMTCLIRTRMRLESCVAPRHAFA
ncbi:MAG: sulfatase/phosphatase domain-containing protein, partial [Planctomycetota bacterium]